MAKGKKVKKEAKKGKDEAADEGPQENVVLTTMRATGDDLRRSSDPFTFCLKQLEKVIKTDPSQLHLADFGRLKRPAPPPKPKRKLQPLVFPELTIVAPRAPARPLKTFYSTLDVHVECAGHTFVIPCSDGSQPVKWLGIAASQRLLTTQKPCGMKRSREKTAVPVHNFILPDAVFRRNPNRSAGVNLKQLDPNMPIHQAFNHGDQAFVQLTAQLDRSNIPLMKTNELGIPKLSGFAKHAFKHSDPLVAKARERKIRGSVTDRPFFDKDRTQMSQSSLFLTALEAHNGFDDKPRNAIIEALTRKSPVKRAAMDVRQIEDRLTTTIGRAFKGKSTRTKKKDAANFRLLMTNQAATLSTEDMADEHTIMVEQDLKECQFGNFARPPPLLEGEDTSTIPDCTAVLLKHFDILCSGYKYFCAQDDCKVGGTSSMSTTQYVNFCLESGLFSEDPSNQKPNIKNVFSETKSCRKSGSDELSRSEFLELILRIGSEMFPEKTTAEATLEVLELNIVPLLMENDSGVSDVVNKELRKEQIQRMYTKYLIDLEQIFNFYCGPSSAQSSQDQETTLTMTLQQFEQCLTDCALAVNHAPAIRQKAKTIRLKSGKEILDASAKVAKVKKKGLSREAIRVAFAQSQQISDSTVEEMTTMEFSEFLEAIARCAMVKWENALMAFHVKLQIALDTVIKLKDTLPNYKEGSGSSPKKPRPPSLVARDMGRSSANQNRTKRRGSYSIDNKVMVDVIHDSQLDR